MIRNHCKDHIKNLEEERRFWDEKDVSELLDELEEVEVEYTPPKKGLVCKDRR